jgi:6-phosphogluconolactonase
MSDTQRRDLDVPNAAPRLITPYPDGESVAQAAASRILLTLGDILAGQERADIALTGGTDGIEVLAVMAKNPLVRTVDWSRVHIWWGDERFVGSDDNDRNAKQAREALLDGLIAQDLLSESHIHEMPIDTRTASQVATASDEENDRALAQAAAEYQNELISQLGNCPTLDIILFGVGPDAHFASLFPGHSEVLAREKYVVGVSHSPKMPPLRVSLTVPMIRRAHRVWVIASTLEKADAVKLALTTFDDPNAPSSFAGGTQETIWMVDKDALSKF